MIVCETIESSLQEVIAMSAALLQRHTVDFGGRHNVELFSILNHLRKLINGVI